jgi:preprotein translocase subunit SecA
LVDEGSVMIGGLLRKVIGTASDRKVKRIRKEIVQAVNALEPRFRRMTDAQLRAKTGEFRRRLAEALDDDTEAEILDELLVEAFAVVRETARRVLQMRHYDVQLIGGVILHRGMIAEMKTGEGKTLVATLPVYLNGLTARGVHVVTVNDYLARRDSAWMGSVYRFLGLSVGTIQHESTDLDRYRAYRADVTYGTNNEFGFDYLRDNMKISLAQFVQREHRYAIVDEVDSILIDEARTPLIISGPTEESTDKYYVVNRIIPSLKRELDYQIEEKTRSVSLTEAGIKKAERLLGVDNLYDPANSELLHHVNQALRAHTLFKRDVHYLVKDGQIVIVDEFTGRLMPGRRYSDGLHQALEAKEGVKIANENQTLASITFQNYFRMYDKLAGMTGTAMTEANEFQHTYKLEPVEIPTNRPLIRINYPDVIYRTAEEKFRAVVREIKELHAARRPVLVGTISVENSEKLARMLRREGITCEVLNAKHHEKEAEIVAKAGQAGAVTISTNMAGRGTDIILGEGVVRCPKDELGNIICCISCKDENCEECVKAEQHAAGEYDHCREEVPCGLHVIGTERHESRRIDNQLRGRAGRQGDPGSSRFYLSLEDDLLRIFGSDRVMGLMERLGMEKDVPIEANMVTKAIESAQRRVEANHFASRKRLLEYDDVMNKQREEVYKYRRETLQARSVRPRIMEMIETLLEDLVYQHAPPKTHPELWDLDALAKGLRSQFHYDRRFSLDELEEYDSERLVEELLAEVKKLYGERIKAVEEFFGPGAMHRWEREIMLSTIDSQWKDHLLAMDHLQEGIQLRGYGQLDPLAEYKKEGYLLFQEMEYRIQSEIVRKLMIPYRFEEGSKGSPLRRRRPVRMQMNKAPVTPVRRKQGKVGRNEPCPCGSGKKYKRCCGR